MNKIIRSALLAWGLAGYALAAAAAPAVPVRVATVEHAPHAGERQISGRVEAIHSVDIRARTEGKIVQRHFQDGQYVNQGDPLFTLDDAQPKAALALAQAELKSVQASLRQAQQQLRAVAHKGFPPRRGVIITLRRIPYHLPAEEGADHEDGVEQHTDRRQQDREQDLQQQ